MAGEDRDQLTPAEQQAAALAQFEAMHRWGQQHNMGLVIGYHNDVIRAVNKLYQDAIEKGELDEIGHRIAMDECVRMTKRTTFLSMFSHIEEELDNMAYSAFRGCDLPKSFGRSGMDRYKDVLREGFGIDPDASAAFQLLNDAQLVRNCLLHGNGRLDRVRDYARVKLEKLRDEGHYDGDLVIPSRREHSSGIAFGGHLQVEDGFINRMMASFRELFDQMIHNLAVKEGLKGDHQPPQ